MHPFWQAVKAFGIFRWCKLSCANPETSTEKKIVLLCIVEAPAVFGNASAFAILGNKEVQQASL